jgi:hypothetical protein
MREWLSFFPLSGFLITETLLAGQLLRAFVVRRAARITRYQDGEAHSVIRAKN